MILRRLWNGYPGRFSAPRRSTPGRMVKIRHPTVQARFGLAGHHVVQRPHKVSWTVVDVLRRQRKVDTCLATAPAEDTK